MIKFYKVIKDNFLWDVGAILKYDDKNDSGYTPIDEIWCKIENLNGYITSTAIEKSPEWFERVYKVDLLTKVVYKGIAEAKEALQNNYK